MLIYQKNQLDGLDSIYKNAGWKVLDYIYRDGIIKPEENVAKTHDVHKRRKSDEKHYTSVPLTYLDHGQSKGSTSAVNKYKNWME